MKTASNIYPFKLKNDVKKRPFTTFNVLKIPISVVQIPGLINFVEKSIQEKNECAYVAFAGMQGVVEAQENADLKTALTNAICVCDGKPLVILGRLNGHILERRVAGPEFMETFCRETGNKYKHFFYGGNEGVADLLADTLSKKYGTQIAGTFCPPFRTLNPEEEKEIIQKINASNADVVWVGIGAPKQELWMSHIHSKLNVSFLFGVGAAYDFLTGQKKRAPYWMGEAGVEWIYRLFSEPKRLWKRYLFGGAKFVYLLAIERVNKVK